MMMMAFFSDVFADISCQFKASGPIYPFGFRTHAHSLGETNTCILYKSPNLYNKALWNDLCCNPQT